MADLIGLMNHKNKKEVLLFLCIIITSSVFYLWMPFGPQEFVPIYAVADNSTHMVLAQEKTKTLFEPYKVSLLVRYRDERLWNKFYVDHESFYWHNGVLVPISDNVYAIFRGSNIYSTINLSSRKYRHHNNWGVNFEPIEKVIYK